MRTTLRRLAVTTAAAVAATGIAVPLSAAPAAAAAPVERLWSLVDTDDDGGYGLYYTDLPGGTRTKVEESVLTDLSHLSASGDGSRITYVRFVYDSQGNPVRSEVVVRDASARAVRVLETLPFSSDKYAANPALSADGTRAVWDVFDFTSDTLVVRKAAVGAGGATTLKSGYSPYAFLGNDTVLVQDYAGTPYTLPFAGGSLSPVSGLPLDALYPTVSPDGTKLAYGLYETAAAADLKVASLSVTDGVATVGTAATVDATGNNRGPAYSRDGSTLYWAKFPGSPETTIGDVWSVSPADGSGTPAALAATATDEGDVAVTNVPSSDATPPADATAQPFVLNGSTPTIRWALPADADLSGVVISRSGKSAYVPAPQTSWVDSGLTLGQDYTYTIKAVDRSGNLAAGVSRSLTAIKPGAYFGTPTSQYSTKTSFPVRFATGAKADTTFWVDYLPYGGTLKSWVNGATGAFRTFGVPGTTNVADTTAVAGGTYAFRVKVQDAHGNTSGWAVGPKAVVPFDQTKATFSGGGTVLTGAAYLGSFRRLSTSSHYARVSLVGNQLMVVGWKCASCGAFAIYDGATRIGTVDTYAATTRQRVLLFSKTYASSGTHTFTIRPLGTSGRPYVALDGFAMRR